MNPVEPEQIVSGTAAPVDQKTDSQKDQAFLMDLVLDNSIQLRKEEAEEQKSFKIIKISSRKNAPVALGESKILPDQPRSRNSGMKKTNSLRRGTNSSQKSLG